MIESPIRRKHSNYPKDFLPANPRPSTHLQKFSFNNSYQISAEVISKYSRSIDQEKPSEEKNPQTTASTPNPQRISNALLQISQEAPLGQRMLGKKPDINAQVLKKPRFSMKNNEEIPENSDVLQASTSPGGIRKQLTDRQAPLPLEDPCRIQLLQAGNKISKLPQSYIKYRAIGNQQQGRAWRSSQKEIMEKFSESRMKHSMNELPSVSKHPLNHSFNANAAKEVYDSFRKRQYSTNSGFGKINSFLMSLKKEDMRMEEPLGSAGPRFDPSIIQKLKEDINVITRSKRRSNNEGKKEEDTHYQNEQSSEQPKDQRKIDGKIKKKQKKQSNSTIPQFLVSYRSSLSYLKDLYARTQTLEQFTLTVKIPKLFTEQLIYKGQQRSELYETAKNIFNELKIPNENIVIKRYTNCTMIISRNVCLIWHFDGKRYLGGWQTEYLDEGCKHGLGLEWQPKNYVYYGEFIKNRREGLGAFKDRNNCVYVGYWKKGKRYEDETEEDQRQYNDLMEKDEDDDPYDNQDAYYEYL